jgi:hypothetical protein
LRIENSFEVPASPELAWSVLNDTPRVIPCMPGAELTEVVTDDHWKAKMAVRFGPIALNFATDVKREEHDDANKRVKLSANAREVRGKGVARATVESSLAASDGGTRVSIVTDLSLSGAVAQYGRGMVQDVSAQLVDQFAACLSKQLEAEVAAQAPAAAEEPPEAAAARVATARSDAVAAVAHSAKPVGGLRLAIRALLRSIGRLFGRGR